MKVLVADSAATRGSKVAADFRALGCSARHRDALPEEEELATPIHYDLVIIHNDQTAICTDAELKAEYVFFYASGGAPSRSQDWFHYPVGDRGLSSAAAAQFVEWLRARRSGPTPMLLGGEDPLLDPLTGLALLIEGSRQGLPVLTAKAIANLRLPSSISDQVRKLERTEVLVRTIGEGRESSDLEQALRELASHIDGEARR